MSASTPVPNCSAPPSTGFSLRGCMEAVELVIPKLMDHVDVDPSTGCWNWKHFVDGRGRARGSVTGCRGRIIARAVWKLNNNPIPKGLCVLHDCDNPQCVNPEHLWLGTKGDNQRDMREKGRAREARGEINSNAKLTEDDVRKIRWGYAEGCITREELGIEFGVCRSTIDCILDHRTWKHIRTRRSR